MNMSKLTDPEGYLRNSDGVIVFVSKSKNKKKYININSHLQIKLYS